MALIQRVAVIDVDVDVDVDVDRRIGEGWVADQSQMSCQTRDRWNRRYQREMLRMVVLWDLIAAFGTQSEQELILEIILAALGFLCLDGSVVVDRTAWK